MSRPSPQRARERALFVYRSALLRGDFETVIAVLKQAERDPVLAQMIEEMAELDEVPLLRPTRLPPHLFRQSKNVVEVVTYREPSADGWLQKPDFSEEENDMLTLDIPARTLPESRRLKFDPITLVAILLMMIFLGALALFMRAAFTPGVMGQPGGVLLQAAQPDPCDPSHIHLEAGQTALDEGDYAQAIQEFSCALQVDPADYEAYLGRGNAALLAGDIVQATLDYVVLRDNPRLWIEAMNRYNDAIEANPDDLTSYTLRSFTNFFLIRREQAQDDCRRIFELDPENAYCYWLVGDLDLGFGNEAPARENFARAVELAPENPAIPAAVAMGFLHAGAAWTTDALDYINRAIELAPTNGFYYLVRGHAYGLAGEPALAGQDIARYFELTPHETIAQNIALNRATILPMTDSRVYSIPFTAEENQTVTVTVNGWGEADPFIVLLNDRGEPLGGDDNGGGADSRLTLVIPADGTYTLLVATYPLVEADISVTVRLS